MKPLRKIEPGGYQVTPVATDDLADVAAWLLKQARKHGLTTLLTHADDGVIWGRMTDEGTLLTSYDVFGEPPSPKLRLGTLQQARLFGERAELLLWRTAAGWQARLAEDDPEGEHYDQSQLLWGDRYIDDAEGFTLVEEGRQGLHHAPPVDVPEAEFLAEKKEPEQKEQSRRPLRLWVRHYLTTNSKTGVVDVALSRLVKVGYKALDAEKKQEVAS
jgi:CRISPR-associated protein (TIGR03984 family)